MFFIGNTRFAKSRACDLIVSATHTFLIEFIINHNNIITSCYSVAVQLFPIEKKNGMDIQFEMTMLRDTVSIGV
jgi:hypothetical protein